MNTSTFSPKIYPQAKGSSKTLSVSLGFAQLKSFIDPVKDYIVDHEASALILLALLLIAGTVFYVDFQPRLSSAAEQPQSSAILKSAEAQLQKRLIDQLSPQIAIVAASEAMPAASTPAIVSVDQPDQSARLLLAAEGPVSEGNHELIHRKGVHHRHHRR